jgi:hypothetical protein
MGIECRMKRAASCELERLFEVAPASSGKQWQPHLDNHHRGKAADGNLFEFDIDRRGEQDTHWNELGGWTGE